MASDTPVDMRGYAPPGHRPGRGTLPPEMLLELDAGERADESEELWQIFDLLNIACGGHAGDPASMDRVVAFCARGLVRVGAHPSYPDQAHFGRRTLTIAADALAQTVAVQCEALAAIARTHDLRVEYVKPHGALYHDAALDPALAQAVVQGARAALGTITVIGPPAGALRDAALASGLAYAREGFADRRMHADGSLVPRSEPDALIVDPARAAAQARRLATQVDALCVHADTPGALAIARAVREAFDG